MLGQCYESHDLNRDSGYTLFYSGINFGGFIAAILCGYIASHYGWHLGFSLAGLGMFIGLFLMHFFKSCLEKKGEVLRDSTLKQKILCSISITFLIAFCFILLHYHDSLSFLPLLGIIYASYLIFDFVMTKRFSGVFSLCGFILIYLLFFTIEDLTGSFFMIFCETQVHRCIGSWEVPSTTLVALNPLTVIFFGLILARVSVDAKLSTAGMLKRCSIAFLLLGLAFLPLSFGQFFGTGGLYPLSSVIICFVFVAMGELLIAPALYSFCSHLSPTHLKGRLMGIILSGRACASYLSGFIGKGVVAVDGSESLFFMGITGIAIFLSIGLAIACFQCKRLSIA